LKGKSDEPLRSPKKLGPTHPIKEFCQVTKIGFGFSLSLRKVLISYVHLTFLAGPGMQFSFSV
jgi:hypothetical protein